MLQDMVEQYRKAHVSRADRKLVLYNPRTVQHRLDEV
jgi:hypothetical protein